MILLQGPSLPQFLRGYDKLEPDPLVLGLEIGT